MVNTGYISYYEEEQVGRLERGKEMLLLEKDNIPPSNIRKKERERVR